MKKSKLFLAGISGILLVFSLVLSGCPSVTETSTVSGVIVSPATASVAKGGTQQFTATVTGDNSPAQTVTWTVTGGGTGTTISTGGILTVAAAETATTLTVKATSTDDTSKSGTATVTVSSAGGSGSGVTFTGIPSQYNEQYAVFRSSSSTKPTGAGDYLLGGSDPSEQGITGVQISNGSVTISVYLLNSQTQALIGPYDGSDQNITIRVFTKNESSFTYQDVFDGDEDFTVDSVNFTNGSATVTVNTGGGTPTVSGVTVSPATASVAKGGTQQFTATVSGTNNPAQTVTWSIAETGKNAGTTISSDGLLSVAVAETQTSLTVVATSTVDTSKSGTATVTVNATGGAPTVTGVTVSPATASVAKGGTQQFTATVSGTNNPAQTVTWSIAETGKNAGTTISSDGLLSVAVAETQTSLTVVATSTVDTSKSGTATVTVSSAAGSGSGVTFTGIDSQYNEQYAMFRSSSSTPPTGGQYLGGAGAFSMSDGTMTITGVQISGGSVTIPAYLGNTDGTSAPYSGSDKSIKIYLSIKNSPTFTSDEMQNDTHVKFTVDSVDFTNGAATVTVTSTNSGTLTIPEIFSITGELPDGTSLMIGIFPTNTTLQEVLSQTGIVAGARNEDVTLSESTATCSLYLAPFESGDEWTGSGTYDVYLVVLLGEVVNEEVVNEGDMSIYQAQNVLFTSGTATIPAEDFS